MQRTQTTILVWLLAAIMGLGVATATATFNPEVAVAQDKGCWARELQEPAPRRIFSS